MSAVDQLSQTDRLGTLRIATAGSVDDGKSTLIGRLLHDTKTVFEDQLSAVKKASQRFGDGSVNLALLTDGLRAEREQGITIDVAHRYFATPKRSFIVADTPGHLQYTRNMVTGASTSNVAIVLVDARHGVVDQTRRHALIASMLGVQEIIVAVNKMDLVAWDQARFDDIDQEFRAFLSSDQAHPNITHPTITTIPMSALNGDNVVHRSSSVGAAWYHGPVLLDHLEGLLIHQRRTVGARVHVQRVIRPQGGPEADFRGQAGVVAGGSLSVGDEVEVLPSGRSTRVRALFRWGKSVDQALPGHAVVVQFDDNVDASRGDVIVSQSPEVAPRVTEAVTVDVCWMTERSVQVGSRWWFKHGTKSGQAVVTGLVHRLDPVTFQPTAAEELGLNDLGRLELSLSEPIVADSYLDSRSGGQMILIDLVDNTTAAAAMITG
jgi:bifunctional enzyme CysN/CysC